MKKLWKKRKKEIIFITACVGIGLLLLLLFWQGSDAAAAKLVVRVGGEQVASFSLDEDRSYEIRGADGGKNLLVIEGKTARIETADCPDELCVKMGRISRSGQSIICLPHQVSVEIVGGKEADADAVAQ